jgi:glycerol-3-phosphate O-acyltransferase / dihydroxyacetone phosphate acyltransferase
MRQLADRVMASFAQLLIHIFFREIEVDHGGNLPPSGPVVLVANHTNGLVDGLLLMATLARYPRFLGKSTLFKIPPLWPFLKLAGVIPVYRAIDGGQLSQNSNAFASSHEILAHGGVVALFPEGISHDEPSLQPLKTGAARIALEAGADSAAAGLVTVPVGLTYDAKARFRSRALVRIGPPEVISRWADGYGADDHQAVRQLTISLAERLSQVNPEFASWEQAEQLARVAEVVARRPRATSSRRTGRTWQSNWCNGNGATPTTPACAGYWRRPPSTSGISTSSGSTTRRCRASTRRANCGPPWPGRR